MKPQGISIHVAVNRGAVKSLAPLSSPAENAQAMRRIAEQAGFETRMLVGPDATCAAVIGAIREAAGPVGGDGILLLTFSGHGSVVRAAPGGDEVEDQCWWLYDGKLVDDDLYRLWAEFEAGARVVVISDSCHSGSIIRVGEPGYVPPSQGAGPEPEVAATVLLLASSGNRQEGREHGVRGWFTAALRDAWQDGAFQGSYLDLHAELVRRLKGKPMPRYYKCGARRPEFEAQRPFTIAPPSTE